MYIRSFSSINRFDEGGGEGEGEITKGQETALGGKK